MIRTIRVQQFSFSAEKATPVLRFQPKRTAKTICQKGASQRRNVKQQPKRLEEVVSERVDEL